jgi:hypothetical protein
MVAGVTTFGRTARVKAANDAQTPLFDMMMQLNVYSIDLKTQTLYSQYYSFLMYTLDPSVQSFKVVILRPDYNQGMEIDSWNESGHQQVYEQISTDPQKVTTPWQWHLNPIRLAFLGTPLDRYELSFLIAVNVSTTLNINDGKVYLPVYLRGDWVCSEDIAAQKLASRPNNQTLTSLGLSPQKFYQYGINTMPADFYLFTVTLSYPFMMSFRMTIAFFLPSGAILVVLIVAALRRKRLDRSDILAIFVGAGIFTLSFLVSFYLYAPPDVFTWPEALLIVDFFFAASLAVYSLVRREESEPESSSS